MDFTATRVTIRRARSGVPVADTLADLEEMHKEFVNACQREMASVMGTPG
ncbi:hypothetical protein E0500_029335 [Streptomyces sp. KM273126]|nr:hypothetical protein [Streptomyces sp. KM273126]MBA2811348.1 hypothetical protein [Streptomyces sp. KM273126]